MHFHHHHHHQQQQQQQHNAKAGRPIIGGLLLSGISQLAEKVTAPDINTSASNRNSNGIPKLYRKDDEIENDNNINTQNGIPKLYRKDDEIDNGVYKTSAQQQQQQPQKINVNNTKIAPDDNVINDNVDEDIDGDGDGWSDDDIDDLDDLDNDNTDILNDDGNDRVNDDVASNDAVPPLPPPPPPSSVEKQKVELDVKNNDVQMNQSTIFNLDSSSTSNNAKEQQQNQQQKTIAQTIENDLAIKMKELMEIKLETNTYVHEDFVYDAKTGIIPTRSRFVPHSDLLSSL